MVKEIKILIQPYPTEGFFLAGSAISGEIVVQTGSKKTYYSKVELTLIGSINSNFPDRENKIRCSHSEDIIKETIVVWDKTEEGKFPKGTSNLPFTLIIPASDSSFPSLECDRSSVSYTLMASIVKDKRGKAPSTATTPVKVFPPVGIGDPELQGPQTTSEEFPFTSCCCLSGGSIEAEIRLKHKSYEVNEVMEFEVEIVNGTRKMVTSFDGGLIQKVVYGGTPTSRFRSNSAILYGEESNLIGERAKGSNIIARSSWAENLIVKVPQVLPPTFKSFDSMLDIEYFMQVRVHRSHNVRDSVTLQCPVVIGNTRARHISLGTGADSHQDVPPSGLSSYGDNPPNYLDVFNQRDDNTTSSPMPSAPSLPRDSFLDV